MGAQTWEEILGIVSVNATSLNEVNCATALQRAAKLFSRARVPPSDENLAQLLTLVEDKMGAFEAFNAQEVANTMWAHAVLQTEPPLLLVDRTTS